MLVLIIKIPMKDEKEALENVDRKKVWGYIKFSEGFSESIFAQTVGNSSTNFNETVAGSQIKVKLDMTSKLNRN